MGAKGSLMVDKGGHRNFMDAFLNREVVDAIGAGDSFNSGFIASAVETTYGKDMSFDQAIAHGFPAAVALVELDFMSFLVR